MSSEGETHAQQPVEETQPAAAEELKPVATNEPVEEGGSSAAVDAVTRPLAPLLFVGLSFVTLLFLIIGTTLPWLRRDAYPAVPVIALVTLWETRVKVIPTQTVTVTKVVDNHCEILRNYFRAAEAFAIISIFFAAGTLLVGLAALAGKKVPLKPVGTILAFATFTASLIAWALMGKAYYMPYCGLASPHDQRFYIYQGAGVFIAGWILSGNALAASLTSLTVPKVLPKEAVDRFLAALVTLLAGVSFVLTVIATPLPFVGRYTGPNTESTFSIWHEYTFTNGDQTSKVALHKSTCGEFGTYAKFAQAFSIISIVATLVALAVGVLRVRGSGSVKGLLATGFFAALVTTITMSAELALYYKRFCTAQSALELNYHFYAGFGLFATAASLMLLAFVVILIVAIARALGAKASEGTSGNVRFGLLFVVSIAISVLFMVISLTTPVFQQDTNDTNYVKVNWWQQETVVAGAYTEQDFQCQEIWERLVGGGALGVIAIVLSAIAGLLGIGQLSNGGLRIPASAIALLAAVLQLTSFALAMGVFQGSYCNFKPYATQYKYAVGFGLMVAAFCLNAVFSLVNLVFGA